MALLKEQVQQLKQTNEQLIHDNALLTSQLKAKDEQIDSAHRLADQAQQLHLSLEQNINMLPNPNSKSVVNGDSPETNGIKKNTNQKSWWHFW